jgi:hypothetical protein
VRPLIAILVFVLTAESAAASCIAQQEDGTWIDTDAATRTCSASALRATAARIASGHVYAFYDQAT